MYRIDNATVVATLPIAGPPGTPGFFTEGNAPTGVRATIVDAWWANIIQEEILTVIDRAGLTPNKASHTQLFEALQTLYQGSGLLGNFLPLAGGTMTGFITLHAYPELTYHAATKGYVDALFAGVPPDMAGLYLPIAGGTLANPGNLTVNGQLAVLGDANVHSLGVGGTLNVIGSVDVSGYSTFRNSLAISGNVNIDQALTVSGGAVVSGLVSAGNGLAVTGNATFNGPITARHGFFYQPGASDPLEIDADSGAYARLRYSVANARLWSAGVAPSGDYVITDETVNRVEFIINPINGNSAVASNFEVHPGLFFGLSTDPIGVARFLISAGGTLLTINSWEMSTQTIRDTMLRFDTAGGINITAYTYNCWKTGGGPWLEISDARVKKDIEPYRRSLDAVCQLRPVSYRFNGLAEMPDDGQLYHGLVAQDVLDIMPEMVGERSLKLRADDAEETALYSLDSGPLLYALVNSIKDLVARLEVLEAAQSPRR